MIEKIFQKKDHLVALIIRKNFSAEGIQFFTPGEFSQQVGYMNRKKGYQIPAHVHNPVKREVLLTQEVLFIKSGEVRVDFYDDDKIYIKSAFLKAGDIILLASGGHGFEIIEDCEMVEIKQGPYSSDDDKTRFEPVKKEKLNIV